MKWRDLPNLISVFRIVLVVPIEYLLLQQHYVSAMILFFLAGISDGLDGFLAKRFNWTSRLGSVLDPLADKLLLVCTYLVLGWLGHLPWWLAAMVVARDVMILIGAAAYYLIIGRYEMEPAWTSKLNTSMQIVLGLAVVLSLAVTPLPPELVETLIYLVALTTLVSGLDYLWTWGRRARQQYRQRKAVVK